MVLRRGPSSDRVKVGRLLDCLRGDPDAVNRIRAAHDTPAFRQLLACGRIWKLAGRVQAIAANPLNRVLSWDDPDSFLSILEAAGARVFIKVSRGPWPPGRGLLVISPPAKCQGQAMSAKEPPRPELLSKRAAADRLGISPGTVAKMIRSGHLNVITYPGMAPRIPVEELDRIKESANTNK